MQRNGSPRAFPTAVAIIALPLFLCGCLAEEEGGSSFSGSADSSPVNGAPVISGNPAGAVKIGEAYSFTPNASDTDNDSLSFAIDSKPSWASFNTGTGKLSGRPTLGNIGVYSNILISVSDGAASASLPRFSISVDQVGTLSTTLSWTPPTENEDGTALTDLDGYKIYWGTTPGNYPNSVTINNEGLTTYVVDNLVPGTYEFVATSFNTAGVESVYSNPATKVVN